MRIGITYNIKDGSESTAEFDSVETIEAIDASLQRLGHKTERIGNAKRLIERLGAGCRWDLVFNISEGVYGAARESQVPCILDAYQIPYTLSNPLVLAVCLDKALTKLVIQKHGILTPDFVMISDIYDVDNIKLPYPLFIKPNSEGTSKGITSASVVHNEMQRDTQIGNLLDKYSEVLVETYLPGQEYTVGIIKDKVVGTLQVDAGGVYSYIAKKEWQDRVTYKFWPYLKDVEDLALKAWQVLKCKGAGRVDVRRDTLGRPNFIEVNPLPGLSPIDSDLPIICKFAGIPYDVLIQSIVEDAKC